MKHNLADMNSEERAIVENGILLIYRDGYRDGYRAGRGDNERLYPLSVLTRLFWAACGMVVAFIASGIAHG